MEVASALASVLFAAFSLPCLLLLVVVAEAALRLAALAVRGDGYAWPSRSAFLGYRIARAGHFSYSSSSSSSSAVSGSSGGFFQQDELLPREFLDLLAVTVYRKGSMDAAVDCVFCLSRIDEGEEVRELRCRHVFHRECLDAWLLRPRATCPLCRDRLLPSEPPRACARAFDDDEIYVEEHEDLSSSSYAAAGSYPHGSALWHM